MKMNTHYLYTITNNKSGKVYVGQTVNPSRRWKDHQWLSKNKQEQYVHRAMAKYGIDNFQFEVIASCRTQEDADEGEKSLIIQYDSRNPDVGYNLLIGGNTGWLGRKHTSESIAKISASKTGTIPSEESNIKRSQTMKEKCINGWIPKTTFMPGSDAARYWEGKTGPRKGMKNSNETRRKISEANKGREPWNKTVLSKDKIDEIIKLSSNGCSVRRISQLTNLNKPLISKILKNNKVS
jgi:group I intron endonuclease